MKDVKAIVGDLSARLIVRGAEQPLVAKLFAGDKVLLAENERMLQLIVDELDRVCKRRILKGNAGKGKIKSFRRQEDRDY